MDVITALVAEVRGEEPRPNASTHAPRVWRRPETRHKKEAAVERIAGQGRGLRLRVVGHRVLDRGRRRRERRHDVGASRGGRHRDQRHARELGVPAGHRAAAVDHRDPRRREGRARRRHRHPRDPVADAARQPRGVGAAHRAERGDGLADEGCRARHAEADERGHRRGHRRRPRADRGDQRAQPGQGDRSPRAGRLRRGVRGRGRRQDAPGPLPLAGVPPLHEHRRARAASSAAPTRTSSAWRSAWPSAWASATTPRRR